MTEVTDYDDGLDDVARHLPYEHYVWPGVVLLEDDDALLAVVEYRGTDHRALDDAAVGQVAAACARAVFPFTSGWTLHFEFQKRKVQGYLRGTGAHPVSAMVDERRRRRFGGRGVQFRSRTYVAITYVPTGRTHSALSSWFVRRPAHRRPDVFEDHVKPFAAAVRQFAHLFAAAVGWAKVVGVGPGGEGDDAEFQGFLHNCISPNYMPRVAVPEIPAWPVKASLCDLGLVPGSFMTATNGHEPSDWHVRVVSIKGYFASVHPSKFLVLDALPFEFRWSVRFECMNHLQAKRVFEKIWRKHDDTAYDWRSVLGRVVGGVTEIERDPVALAEALEAVQARLEADRPEASSGWMTPTVVVWARTVEEVEDRAEQVRSALQKLDLLTLVEGWGAFRAWLGTLPGHVRPNPRRIPLTQVQMSDFLVLSKAWEGPDDNPHLGCDPLMRVEGEGGTPLNVDIHQGQDGGCLVVGGPRNGKSTLLAMMGHQFLERVPGARVRMLDVDSAESTSQVATWAAGGQMLSFGGFGGVALQPYVAADTDMQWCVEHMVAVFRSQGVVGRDVSESEARHYAGIVTSHLANGDRSERTMAVAEHLMRSKCRDLALALETFCPGSPNAGMLDATSDPFRDCPWITVDVGALMEAGPVGEPVFMALNRAFHREFLDGRPTLYMVDEAFKMLQRRPQDLEEMRRRGPKKNVSLVLSTHLLEDIEGSPVAAMLKTIRCIIALHDANATKRTVRVGEKVKSVYREYGFNWRQAKALEEMAPARDLLFKAPQGTRVGRLHLSPLELAICGQGGEAARTRSEAVMARAGPGRFAAEWLREMGFHGEAAELEGMEDGDGYRIAAE
jgi:type IV secretion system protein VirB4